MFKKIKDHLEWARVGCDWENMERDESCRVGGRAVCYPDGYDNVKIVGPQANIPFWLYFITYHAFEQVLWSMRHAMCHYRGHHMVDHSFVGPETAYDSYCCSRCGWSFEHTYY